MKIVDVCAFYAPRGGGVKTYIEHKLREGPAREHEIVVIAPGKEDRIELRGPLARIVWMQSPIFPLDSNYRFFADRDRLHALLDAEAPDMVEVSSPWRSASIIAGWRGATPKALIAHADPLSAFAYRWFGGVADRPTIDKGFDWYWRHLRRIDRDFDLVVSASESLSARLREGGLTKVVTNPMGVEAGVFSPLHRDERLRADLLAQCGLPAEATLLLGVGRHSPEKRWEMVIGAATAAGGRAPVGLVLVGGGRTHRRTAKAIAGNPHIVALKPIADRPALARLMASADALIHGCEAETFCFAAAEGLASGLPLIVPDEGGASDQGRASAGYLYEASNPVAATEAILRFVRDRAAGVSRAYAEPRTMAAHFDALFAIYAQHVRRDERRRA
ncbi:alpha-1,6-mannosyltransferase [Sphingomonas vulcanisoli]|uniref:Alpha-1,6-mannosyltransferase n=1 Tax=Sphingomonas vulcanisoli TaxID=1658060 RepID=A0ABX0TUE5_9SPHN|nr:glycosyltransferase [Sphingomonas vulcanisoli]NIJ07789.1 alpha-1,6-mannosyltransferase [Sphingomonas vulcanisoli]